MSAPAHKEPESFAFDAESEAKIATILKRYPEGKQASAVIPLLYVAQRQMGRLTQSAWVPRVAMDVIAAELRAADEGLLLIEGSSGYRLMTQPRFARWLRILRQEPPPDRLDPR